MPEIDQIKSKIDILRDDHKNLFYVFFAVTSGSLTIIYKVLISQDPAYLIFLALLGFVTSSVLFVKMMHVREDIKKTQDELRRLP